MWLAAVVIAAVALALALVVLRPPRYVIIYEYERALKYKRGRFTRTLEPGAYWIWPRVTTLRKLDVRPTFVVVPGQEVLTADGAGLKVSLAARYRIVDPRAAVAGVADYAGALYTHLQLALREIVATLPVDGLLEARGNIGKLLVERAAPDARSFGIELEDAEIKDIMFPGELKKVFAQVVKARQEGLAALERARGETAALRNLANAATLLEQRPALLQLRALQTVGQATGNTVVLGVGGSTLLPLRQEIPEHPAEKENEPEEGE